MAHDLICGLAAAAILAGAAAEAIHTPGPGPGEDLMQAYVLCDEAAATGVLDRGQVLSCAAIFQAVKLSFLPDLDASALAALPAAERARANRQGYTALLDWRQSHPAEEARLRAVARRLLEGHGR